MPRSALAFLTHPNGSQKRFSPHSEPNQLVLHLVGGVFELVDLSVVDRVSNSQIIPVFANSWTKLDRFCRSHVTDPGVMSENDAHYVAAWNIDDKRGNRLSG